MNTFKLTRSVVCGPKPRFFRSFAALSQTVTPNTPSPPLNPSISEAEVAKFRALSSKWWTGAEFLPLRNMNQLRVPFIAEAFQSKLSPTDVSANQKKLPLAGVKLLDIGCGGGILSEALSRLGANVTSIDPAQENVNAALEHARMSFRNQPDRVPNYKSCSIEELAADPANVGAFDGVVASEVLEHVDDIATFLQCSIDCIRPGGFFFITTMNQTPVALLTAVMAAEEIGLVPKGTHDYDKFVPPKALSLVLADYNCDTVQVHGMFFNPITLQWSWTQNQWVSYALAAVKRA